MPDLYVNSAAGADAAGRGDASGTALRSLTFAVNEAARRFGADRTAIHLAAGTYDRSSGEVFPIEMPQNVSVRGANRETTFIVVERRATDSFNVALSGGEELTRFTLRAHPWDPGSCLPLTGIYQDAGETTIHDLAIELSPGAAAGEVAFLSGLRLWNRASVERVDVSGCSAGIVFGGGVTVVSSRASGNQKGLVGVGPGTVSDCHVVSNHTGVVAYAGSGMVVEDCAMERNMFGVAVEGHSEGLREGMAIIRGNHVEANTYGIACFADAEIVANEVICTNSEETGLLAGTTFPAGVPHLDGPVFHPVFRGNEVRREGPADRSRRQAPLALFGTTSAPVVENNRFWTVDGWALGIVEVHHASVPDFGGGGSSAGGNRFESGWFVINQREGVPKTIFAHDNFWRRVPPQRGLSVYGPGDWYVDPADVRDTVVFDTTGARLL
jgi:hypothetical protein